jgi:hypothetical protein
MLKSKIRALYRTPFIIRDSFKVTREREEAIFTCRMGESSAVFSRIT